MVGASHAFNLARLAPCGVGDRAPAVHIAGAHARACRGGKDIARSREALGFPLLEECWRRAGPPDECCPRPPCSSSTRRSCRRRTLEQVLSSALTEGVLGGASMPPASRTAPRRASRLRGAWPCTSPRSRSVSPIVRWRDADRLVKAAFDAAGAPTQAAAAFARSCGAAIGELETLTTEKGAWRVFRGMDTGAEATASLLAAIVNQAGGGACRSRGALRWGRATPSSCTPGAWRGAAVRRGSDVRGRGAGTPGRARDLRTSLPRAEADPARVARALTQPPQGRQRDRRLRRAPRADPRGRRRRGGSLRRIGPDGREPARRGDRTGRVAGAHRGGVRAAGSSALPREVVIATIQ